MRQAFQNLEMLMHLVIVPENNGMLNWPENIVSVLCVLGCICICGMVYDVCVCMRYMCVVCVWYVRYVSGEIGGRQW